MNAAVGVGKLFGGTRAGVGLLRHGTRRPFSHRPMKLWRTSSSYETRQTAKTLSETPASFSPHGPAQSCTQTWASMTSGRCTI